jgi:hypothetical protein
MAMLRTFVRIPGLLLAVATVLQCGGCTSLTDSTADIGGFGLGSAVGVATGNPLIGVGVGLAARAGIVEGLRYYHREEAEAVQEAIAAAGGDAPLEQTVSWSVDEDLPLVSAEGQVFAVREFGDSFRCREIVFTDSDVEDHFFVATICKGVEQWNWALAEPATNRWGDLQ